MILCHSWDYRSVEAGIDTSMSGMLDHYRHLRSLLEEDGLFEQLLQATVGPRWNLEMEAVERLTRYGVMRRVADADDYRFRGWSEHFQSFLEKCAREMPFWDIWRQTENTLRDLIETVCEQVFGSQWISVLEKRHSSLAMAIAECTSRMQKEQRHFGLSASDRLLEYTYPMELWAIIAAEWQHFRTILGQDKRYWNERFNMLSKLRNPTAHNREHVIPGHELAIAQGYCKELLAVIDK
jgi:hypothetical protein